MKIFLLLIIGITSTSMSASSVSSGSDISREQAAVHEKLLFLCPNGTEEVFDSGSDITLKFEEKGEGLTYTSMYKVDEDKIKKLKNDKISDPIFSDASNYILLVRNEQSDYTKGNVYFRGFTVVRSPIFDLLTEKINSYNEDKNKNTLDMIQILCQHLNSASQYLYRLDKNQVDQLCGSIKTTIIYLGILSFKEGLGKYDGIIGELERVLFKLMIKSGSFDVINIDKDRIKITKAPLDAKYDYILEVVEAKKEDKNKPIVENYNSMIQGFEKSIESTGYLYINDKLLKGEIRIKDLKFDISLCASAKINYESKGVEIKVYLG